MVTRAEVWGFGFPSDYILFSQINKGSENEGH